MHTNQESKAENQIVALDSIRSSTVLVRVAYDLSDLDSTFRIENSLDTIRTLKDQNNTIILLTHWGRPKAKEMQYSVQKMLSKIVEIFNQNHILDDNLLVFIDQYSTTFEAIKETISKKTDNFYILENTRFDPRETSESEAERLEMAREYAQLADYFVDESFALSHRNNATNQTIKQCIPYAQGEAYQKEIEVLSSIIRSPQKPFIVISGGAKLETKIPVLQNLAYLADKVLIAGLICFTLLKAQGNEIPGSTVDEDYLDDAEILLNSFGDKIILPIDFIYDTDPNTGLTIPVDIGPKTIELFSTYITPARSLFWNGPLGYYEAGFNEGCVGVAQAILANTQCYSVIGGGDVVASLPHNVTSSFDFVSAGGGATLDFLARNS